MISTRLICEEKVVQLYELCHRLEEKSDSNSFDDLGGRMIQRGTHLFLLAATCLFLGACADETGSNPAEAQHTYGDPVDATDAIPTPAIVAEANRYRGTPITVDGRILGATQNGCALHLATDGGLPVLVDTARTDEDACAWQVPRGTKGFAVATGTLHATGDTLRLPTHGVQVTPLQPAK